MRNDTIFYNFVLCFLTAALFILSFPKTNIYGLAWIALIPWLMALDGKAWKQSFKLGYGIGILFFSGMFFWISHVTIAGAVLLILYLALYFGLFSLGSHYFSKQNLFIKLVSIPSLWVVCEYLRTHLLTSFNWACLGHSQYLNVPFIQIADVTGVAGVSFLIVLVNVLLKELLIHRKEFFKSKELIASSVGVCVLVVCVLGYGELRLSQKPAGKTFKVGVVQGNISQEAKWNPVQWPNILTSYLDLTTKASLEKPDLIVWPETSFPGYFWMAPQLLEKTKMFVKQNKIPLLFGVVTEKDDKYFNSAILLGKDGEIALEHHKLHLVPFGEFIPFRKTFPFLADIIPIEDFTEGVAYTPFPVEDGKSLTAKDAPHFSVLICFEDTVETLARAFVDKGSGLLINITNDAWFKDTKAPFMHLQSSVFRSVENRRALVRSANTGVSCFVNSRGNILSYVKNPDSGKRTYVPGYGVAEVVLSQQKTFYTKHGDIFTYLCFGIIFCGIVSKLRKL